MKKSVLYYEKQLTKVVDNFEVFLSERSFLQKSSHDSLVHMQEQANRISRLVADTDLVEKQPASIIGQISVSQMQQIVAAMDTTDLKLLQALVNQALVDRGCKSDMSISDIVKKTNTDASTAEDGCVEVEDTFYGSLYSGLQIVDESDLLRW